MDHQFPPSILSKQRRSSAVSERLYLNRLEEVLKLSPAQRLVLALELSDTCRELSQACWLKP